MSKQPDSNRIGELDALRGIAALMVVFFHFTMGKPQAQFGFSLGCTGVHLFFMISGFVIFMSLQNLSKSSEFIINRVSRLYPTYWACVTFSFLINVVFALANNKSIDVLKYLGNMTMFQYYLKIKNLDGPFWTMIIEMLFYIAMLILFHFNALKHIFKIGFVAVFSIVCIALFMPYSYVKVIFLAVPLLPYLPLFFSGIIFYSMFKSKKGGWKEHLMILFSLVAQITLYTYTEVARAYISQFAFGAMLCLYHSVFFLFVHGKLVFLKNRTLLFLGSISFALYLIHQKISVSIIIPYLTETLNLNFWTAALIFALPIVLGIAYLITKFIEVPQSKRMKLALRHKFLK